jgi:hypothetical protein
MKKETKVTKAQRYADYRAEQVEEIVMKCYTRRWAEPVLIDDKHFIYWHSNE